MSLLTLTVFLVVSSCNWTSAEGQTPCSLSGPQSLSSAVLSPTSVHLTWVTPCHTQQYHIYYNGTCGAYVDEGRLDTDHQEHTFDELQEGTNYTFIVNQTGLSGGRVFSIGPVYARTFTAVPSGAPQSLEGTFVQPTEVSLRWREVPCIHQNGPITGYIVRYYVTFGADRGVQQNKSVTTGVIIEGLTPNTEYSFQVAAVNINGTGPFSEPVTLGGSKAQNWVAAGVTIAVVVVLLIVAVVQCAVIWHMWRLTTRKKSQAQRVTTKTTEIPMKECAAYRQVDPSGERSEETSLYALPR